MAHPTAADIRRQFIAFFQDKCGHTFVPSSPCVPLDDPTLMFANAGMNQFKPIFLGQQAPDVDKWPGATPGMATRAANTQKCIRAGGKHNDLDDVGHDTYHHTFFEMLGNWSFGDYFKKEAIEWAWELLTKVWGVDASRLHATYFQGDPAEGLEPDNEARELWCKILPPERVHPGNKKDNFWEMGDTGPCGPCSEIHIDLTPDKSGGKLVNAGDARVMEIWNLVFIQYNATFKPGGEAALREFERIKLPADWSGDENEGRKLARISEYGTADRNEFLAKHRSLSLLPAKHVDTGMGFERITSVLQGKKSNYDTDVFAPIFAAIRAVTDAPAYTGLLEAGGEESGGSRKAGKPELMKDIAYRVVADHIRTLTFALTDGAVPSSEGRGYVLRRILRRAVRYGRQYLGTKEPFLCDLVPAVAAAMGEAFPELKAAHGGRNVEHVAALVRDEEASFIKTLDRGITLFNEAAEYARTHHHGRISGEDAFKLHDTFGFPFDLTELMAIEQGMTVDKVAYERLMEEARDRARAGGKSVSQVSLDVQGNLPATDDSPKYVELRTKAKIVGYIHDNRWHDSGDLPHRAEFGVVLDRTCSYGEQGGQVGDQGAISAGASRFVFQTTARLGDTVVHLGRLDAGELKVGQDVEVAVDSSRAAIMKNHTVTHVMNWALRDVLGDHVQQKGSLVDDEKTRFDLSHHSQISETELARIEQLTNEQIARDLPVYTENEVDQSQARQINTLRAVFGEKYPDRVRVVSVGAPIGEMLADPKNDKWMGYSVEFCGGTHVKRTGEIGRFRLVEESAVAKGVRRVVGVTGEHAQRVDNHATTLARLLKDACSANDAALPQRIAEITTFINENELPVVEKMRMRADIAHLQEKAKQAQKEAAKAGAAEVMSHVDDMLATAKKAGEVSIICGALHGATVDQLRAASDSLRGRAGSAALLLASDEGGKVTLLAAMTPDVVKKGVKAGDLIKEIAPVVGGKGGGRPDMAQGGGPDAAKMGDAVEAARAWLAGKLG